MTRFIHSIAKRGARLVASISSLEAVYVWARPWGFECWLVANQSTEEERFRLYDLEWDFMEQFPDLGFKFNLVDREGKPLSEVMSFEGFDAVTQLMKRPMSDQQAHLRQARHNHDLIVALDPAKTPFLDWVVTNHERPTRDY